MKFKKFKTVCLFIVFFLFSALVGCTHGGTSDKQPLPAPAPVLKESTVRASRIPDGVEQYDGAEVKVGGKAMPLYKVMVNTSQVWTPSSYKRAANGVCLFELDGIAHIVVKPKTKIDYSSQLRPLSAKITPIANLEENTLTFDIKSAGEYVLEINADPYDTIHFFVSETDSAGKDKYSGYANVVVFEAGLHTAQNDSRINGSNNNVITLTSNTLVYLADGAVVRGRFFSDSATNVAVVGRGIIDGSTFERDANKGTVTVPFEFNYCKNILLEDFTVLDPAGWTVSSYFTTGGKINNIKIISSRSNGDGISLQSNKHVSVDGCFVRSWDDSLVVKNYPRWDNRSVHGETEDIKFTNCTVWTDLAQCMEIGYETVGIPMRSIVFDNITVLHAMDKAVFSIHDANNAQIENVKFTNITVEDGKRAADGNGIIDFRVLFSSTWSNQHTAPTALGNVYGVTVENVKVVSAKRFTAVIGGCTDTRKGFESEHTVENVTIKNISLAGQRPTESECRIAYTGAKYVKNIRFVQEEDFTVTGAQFVSSQTAEYLSDFGKNIKTLIIGEK